MSTLQCGNCAMVIEEEALVPHLEECSVGFVPFEEVKLSCGQCPFRSSKERVQLMIKHCATTGHDPNGVRLNWKSFVELESARTIDLLRIGAAMWTPLRVKQRQLSFTEENIEEVDRKESQMQEEMYRNDASLQEEINRKEVSMQEEAEEMSKHLFHDQDSEEEAPINEDLEFLDETAADIEHKPKPKKAKTEGSGKRGRKSAGPALSAEERTCVQCGPTKRVLTSSKEAIRHVALHEPSLALIKCGVCGHGCRRKDSLLKHIKGQHRGAQCEIQSNVDEQIAGTMLDRVKSAFPLVRDWTEHFPFSVDSLQTLFM